MNTFVHLVYGSAANAGMAKKTGADSGIRKVLALSMILRREPSGVRQYKTMIIEFETMVTSGRP